MANRRRSGFLVAAVSACCLLAGGPSAAQSDDAEALRIAMNSDIRGTNPGVNREVNTDTVIQHVVEGLVAYREDATVGPLLADHITVSKDGLTYTFTLRPNIKFHNGATLTAEDVAWSWKRYLDPATGWQCLPLFDGRGHSKIEEIAAKDPRTVAFRISKPNALFLAEMANIQCGGGAVLHKDSVNADGSWKEPVSTGPFTIKEWKKGQYVELARFRDYRARPGERDGYTGNKTAHVERVRFAILPDEAAAKAALLRGEIDVLPYLSRESRTDLSRRPQFVVGSHLSNNTAALLLQTRDPLLQDVRVRRAFALAVDAQQLAQVVAGGSSAMYNPSMVPLANTFYSSAHKEGFKPDLERAKALLKEAGYNGQPLKIVTNKRYSDMYSAALIVQSMARLAGFNIEVEVLDWAAQLDRYAKGDYQLMSFAYSARLDPALAFEAIIGAKSTQPRKVWDSPQAQALLDESFSVSDTARRQTAFDQLHRLMLEDVPIVIYSNQVDEYAHSARVQGYKSWVAGKERAWGVRLVRQPS